MEKDDNRIRKQWLTMWVLSLVISVVNHLLLVLFDPSLVARPQVQFWSIISGWLGALAYGLISYHCIYKKPGTKLLTFSLIFTLLCLGINPILYLNNQLPIPDYIPYYRPFLLLTQFTGLLWLIVSWRMLKLNRRLQVASRLPT